MRNAIHIRSFITGAFFVCFGFHYFMLNHVRIALERAKRGAFPTNEYCNMTTWSVDAVRNIDCLFFLFASLSCVIDVNVNLYVKGV